MRLGALALGLALGVLAAAPAGAHGEDEDAPPGPPVAAGLSIEAVPLFTSVTSATGAVVPSGWNEVLVRVKNATAAPVKGEIKVADRQFAGHEPQEFVAIAPFSVGAGAAVHVRMPVDVALYSSLSVEVRDESGQVRGSAGFSTYQQSNVVMLDVSEPSRVREAIDTVPVAPRFTPPWAGGGSRGAPSAPTLTVVTPRFDPATGDPLLPDRAALYAPADAVVARSDVIVRLAGDELDALAKYVIGGGTLAIAVARPEDLRHPTLVALAGGAIEATSPSAPALAELVLPVPLAAGASGSRPVPGARRPADETLKTLMGYRGGNLHGSAYGNSAAYGLGEVHLLAFDPTRKPAMDDPWAQARLVDLGRRAFDRRATLVFRPGSKNNPRDYSAVRKELDPNESSRWAIGAAALLLCVYALLAGPFNFRRASQNGKPLRALWHLPVYSAVAFGLVLGIGAFAKGVRGRSRHLTLVEAGAGMKEGSARRFRAFYAARSEKLTVRTSDRSSVVATAIFESGERHDTLVVDRDGARLVNVAALPWQTVVVREDGSAQLGEGIAITRDGDDDALVVNRSGRKLRGAVLKTPDGKFVYLGALADGAKASSRTAKTVASMTDGAKWEAMVKTATTMGGLGLHGLNAPLLHPVLDPDAPGLADAWNAIEQAAGDPVDWFPEGAAVLLAQIDGGEGRRADAGLALESDRLLVRVMGFGGAP